MISMIKCSVRGPFTINMGTTFPVCDSRRFLAGIHELRGVLDPRQKRAGVTTHKAPYCPQDAEQDVMKRFVGGSRQMGRLNEKIREKLDNIMTNSFTILAGDANGVDKAVQKDCADKRYKNATVFCAGNSCRNNHGRWETRHVTFDRATKDCRFYMTKDLQMAKEADYGFMIWDAQSSEPLSNILVLLEMDRKVLVYIGPTKAFVKLQGTADLQPIIQDCPPEAIKTFDKKFNLSSRLQARAPQQLNSFS